MNSIFIIMDRFSKMVYFIFFRKTNDANHMSIFSLDSHQLIWRRTEEEHDIDSGRTEEEWSLDGCCFLLR